MEPENYDQLRRLVSETGGVVTVETRLLRDIHGAGKLGVNVRTNISNELKGHGLGHYPTEIPQYHWDPTRLYVLGSPAGSLIDAVLNPSTDADNTIREAIDSDAATVLAKVKEIVCA